MRAQHSNHDTGGRSHPTMELYHVTVPRECLPTLHTWLAAHKHVETKNPPLSLYSPCYPQTRTKHGQVNNKANTEIYTRLQIRDDNKTHMYPSFAHSFVTQQAKILEHKKHANMYLLLETKTEVDVILVILKKDKK